MRRSRTARSIRGSLIALALGSSVLVVGQLPAQAAAAPGIKVQGDLIVTTTGGTLGVQTVTAGQAVVLRGVNFSGAEYGCLTGTFWDNPQGDQATIDHMRLDWHANVVRLPLNEGCWLGLDGRPGFKGTDYINAMATFVNLATSSGMIVEVNLHFGVGSKNDNYPALDAAHAPAFWQSVANTFKANPSVILNLINEPHGISWQCLRDGCPKGSGTTYDVVGTQSVLNTVRATGATNPVIIAGLDWSDDLSQWLQWRPTDALNPSQLIAGFHPYFGFGNRCEVNPPTCWNNELAPIQTAGFPLIANETGEVKDNCAGTQIGSFMDWADAQTPRIGYWAWAFTVASCSRGPALISDSNGTPTVSYGVNFRNRLLAIQ